MFFFHSHVCHTSLTNLHCICKITYKILDKHESVRYNNSTLKNNIAGWSSSVARRAHNPKAVGSNPAPATKSPLISQEISGFSLFSELFEGSFSGAVWADPNGDPYGSDVFTANDNPGGERYAIVCLPEFSHILLPSCWNCYVVFHMVLSF